MTVSLFLKVSAVWLAIVILAIGNGLFRESVLVPYLGQGAALPVSGISLSFIVFIVTYLAFPIFSKNDSLTYILVGVQWVLMTLLFEFVFGHYVIGKSWSDLIQVFNVLKGNLFVFVLVTSLFSPIIVAKIKGVR